MKHLTLIVTVALSISPSLAFVPPQYPIVSPTKLNAKIDVTPEIEAAIADVRDAASAFGEETAGFANRKCLFACTSLTCMRVVVLHLGTKQNKLMG